MISVNLIDEEDFDDFKYPISIRIKDHLITLNLDEALELRNKIETLASKELGLDHEINKLGRIIKRLPNEIIRWNKKYNLNIKRSFDGIYTCKYEDNYGDFINVFSSINLKQCLLALECKLNEEID